MPIVLFILLMISAWFGHFLSGIFPVLFIALIFTVYFLAQKSWAPEKELKAIKIQVLIVAAVLGLVELLSTTLPAFYQMAAFVLGILHVGMLLIWKFKATRKMTKMVEVSGIIFLLGFSVLNIGAFK